MLNQMQKTACALVVLATTALPALAESVEVKVIGAIAPTACTPTLSGNGTVDYGNISPTALQVSAPTILDKKTLTFSIVCDGLTKMGVFAKDNRMGTVPNNGSATTLHGSYMSVPAYGGVGVQGSSGAMGGLGNKEKPIGGFVMFLEDVQLDNNNASIVYASSNGDLANNNSWGTTTSVDLFYVSDIPNVVSWRTGYDNNLPTSFYAMSGTVSIQAALTSRSQLDLGEEIIFDGSATLELFYL